MEIEMSQDWTSVFLKNMKDPMKIVKKKLKPITKALSNPTAVVKKYIKANIASLLLPLSKREDYIKISQKLIAKKLILLVTVIVVFLVVAIKSFIYPWAEGVLWTPTITLNSKKFHEYSGEAKIVDPKGSLIYEGEVKGGIANGEGVQYGAEGNLHYKGDFAEGEYSGKGELYEDGELVYKGDFGMSAFEGKGNLYDEEGTQIFIGDFQTGLKNGIGTEYISKDIIAYQGSFANGHREGSGVVFEKDGETIKYQGDFLAGEYSGIGKLYKDGKLLYFGDFFENRYNGIGQEFDLKTGKPIYEGEFLDNNRAGMGELFNALGLLEYQGAFHDDDINMKSYLGLSKEDIEGGFGLATVSDAKSLIYRHMDIAFVMIEEACEQILIASQEKAMGITFYMDEKKVHDLMGIPDFTVNYPIEYSDIFIALGIDVKKGDKLYGDKYIMENHYIKIYYENNGEKVIAVEIGGM